MLCGPLGPPRPPTVVGGTSPTPSAAEESITIMNSRTPWRVLGAAMSRIPGITGTADQVDARTAHPPSRHRSQLDPGSTFWLR
jgi:hypothetical protein